MSGETVRKNFNWPTGDMEQLASRRLSWHLESPSRVKEIGGIASQNVFALCLMKLAMEAIEEPRASDRLWELLFEQRRLGGRVQ